MASAGRKGEDRGLRAGRLAREEWTLYETKYLDSVVYSLVSVREKRRNTVLTSAVFLLKKFSERKK